MLYKTDITNLESPDGTGYNDPPFNFKELTAEEFAHSGFIGGRISYIEFRQMIVNSDLSRGKGLGGKLIQAKLFWFDDDTGMAISTENGKIRFFSFGCNHSLTDPERNDSALDKDFTVNAYQSNKTYRCTKCNSDVHEPWMDLIVEDSGWYLNKNTSIVYRGIRDYDRKIKFSRQLNDQELSNLTKFMTRVNCPGYTGVGGRHTADNNYLFTTTYDSSD